MMDIPALLTAIAAIMAAVAWPSALLVVLLIYRKPIGNAAAKIPMVLDRVNSLKIGALEAELERVASVPHLSPVKGDVTFDQARTAAKIESQVSDLGLKELLKQLDRLCLEYDTVRNSMHPGYERTSAMTSVLIRMRALAPSTSFRVDTYKDSGSPGNRLAAIAMMQMEPNLGDLEWLEGRFRIEQPFVFYQAALALRNMATRANSVARDKISTVAKSARAVLEDFKYGVPDADTIEVLSSI